MSWLKHSQNEVEDFHPAFEGAAKKALANIGRGSDFEWVHHPQIPGKRSRVPDYVLRRSSDQKWLLVVEIKRAPNSVFSTRYRSQAKSYADENRGRFGPGGPYYYALTNLEDTVLFALRPGHSAVDEQKVKDGYWQSGDFGQDGEAKHRAAFVEDFAELLPPVLNGEEPDYDNVWPSFQSELQSHASALPDGSVIQICEPATPKWEAVRGYFANSRDEESKKIFLLRCLFAEYLRGGLKKESHHRAGHIPPMKPNQDAIARTLAVLRRIDFQPLFEDQIADDYRDLSDEDLIEKLVAYVKTLKKPSEDVAQFAFKREDSEELRDTFFSAFYPVGKQGQRGKVQTDPELAQVVAALAMPRPVDAVVDPCCGDGPLLLAAYRRLRRLRVSHKKAATAITGMDADPVAVRLAAVRLAMERPAIVSQNQTAHFRQADMFADASPLEEADVVVMNPPFKRYEAQGEDSVPEELRDHYAGQIRQQGGAASTTTGGQSNLFNFYVEMVGKSLAPEARMAVILDNKWYQNKYGKDLRKYLLDNFQIEGVVEYPHDAFFSDWDIATSILVARKKDGGAEHEVQFVRSKENPRSVDLEKLCEAFHAEGDWPFGWTCETEPQSDLGHKEGWKDYFATSLEHDFRKGGWPTPEDLFRFSRRGSLQKEGGGTKVYAFPFSLGDYGPVRKARPGGTGYQTDKGADLSDEDNEELSRLAEQIPPNYRGHAIKNSSDLSSYVLGGEDVTAHQTIEPPHLRTAGVAPSYFTGMRVRWGQDQEHALNQLKSQGGGASAYIDAIKEKKKLTTDVLEKKYMWDVLREPVAGELIFPRKLRAGHRVYVNPYAFEGGRQVRMSSNFISYGECQATEDDLSRETATKLIAAFLVSSFGQLQLELLGYNREGALAIEKHHINRVRVFDPRWVSTGRKRDEIVEAFENLPYPIDTRQYSPQQPKRNALDKLFAAEIARKEEMDKDDLLREVHDTLDEWLMARSP